MNNALIKYQVDTGNKQLYTFNSDRNNRIISLTEDDFGNIWGASNSRLIKFSKSKHTFDLFPTGIEIPVNGFMPRSVAKTKEGSLVFGGGEGFIRFYAI